MDNGRLLDGKWLCVRQKFFGKRMVYRHHDRVKIAQNSTRLIRSVKQMCFQDTQNSIK